MKIINSAALIAIASGDINNFITANTPGGIEAQEKLGQLDFTNRQLLPKQMDDNVKSKLEGFGIKFLEEHDDLFLKVELPKNWKIVPDNSNSYWSDLVNDRGKTIAQIFYKAAFYDRRCRIHMQ